MYEREVVLGSDDGKISVLSEDLYLEKQWTAHKASNTDKEFESRDIQTRLQTISTLFIYIITESYITVFNTYVLQARTSFLFRTLESTILL